MARAIRLGLLGIACIAGISTALLLSVPLAGADDGTGTTPTGTTPTDTTPTDTTPTDTTPTGPRVAATGVSVAGTVVGGMTAAQMRPLLERRFAKSFLLVISPLRSKRVAPAQLGARAQVGRAIEDALGARPGATVRLEVRVDEGILRRFVARLARDTDRVPLDSHLRLVRFKPIWTRSEPGRRLKQEIAVARLRATLERGSRAPLPLPYQVLRPSVTEQGKGPVIVILRDSKELRYYVGARLARVFHVATGQASYPTPLGHWTIVNKQRDPWWYPPQGSAWAAGKDPVPPGPGNPLGTRWMGLSAPAVGIHGTPDAASIGYSASHGCIRMLISQAEWLFERVDLGTPVYIVPA